MDTENIVTEQNEPLSQSQNKKEIKRSASYPASTINEAYEFASRINTQFSATNAVTRDEIAQAFNLNSSYISRDVAACVQYGLLDKKEGKYQLTKLFLDIFRPESEKEKKINLITAFGKPKLYSDLISKFDGNVIPQEINNTLIKHHSISESAAQEAANTFIESATQVGVIGDNRVLKYNVTLGVLSKTQYAEIIEETPNPPSNGNGSNNQVSVILDPNISHANKEDKKIPIHLTKDKMAYLVYPANTNAKDIKLLDHAIKGILLRLELENEEDNKEEKKEGVDNATP